ncbi:MAG: glycoside hydrolase family 88 protein, partial [Acidobacteria bacterium]|nr:glycoside hydrolase family 88 protein [Acidobacteriota bacterium]
THDHDMGFLYTLSSVAEYTITRDPEAREMAMAAARSLAARFNPFGQFLRAWNDWPDDTPEYRLEKRGKAIVDSMMNLPLLWWAWRETGITMFSDIAHAHAKTTIKYFLREDGSTCHTFNFDPVTAQPLEPRTHQGLADDSCWARGQAWALYGFALAYTATGTAEYLEASRTCARFWSSHTPETGIPPWDFSAPGQPLPDTSAAAIAACGLMELSQHVGDEEGRRYQELAVRSLSHLGRDFWQADSYMGLLTGGVSHMPRKQGVGVSLIYGDYFFLEGLLRAQGRTPFCWCPLQNPDRR